MNPFSLIADYFTPEGGYENQTEAGKVRAMLFFGTFSFLAGLYSAIKWYNAGEMSLVIGAQLLVIGAPMAAFLAKGRVLPPIVIANLAVACFAIYTNYLNYYLGGIKSDHILWVLGIISLAYLITNNVSALCWFVGQFLFTTFLIVGKRSGWEFPVVEFTESQAAVNLYSGYLLPLTLITFATAYAEKMRRDAMESSELIAHEAKLSGEKTEKLADELGVILEEATHSAEFILKVSNDLNAMVSSTKIATESIATSVERQAQATSESSRTLGEMATSVNDSTSVIQQIRSDAGNAERTVSKSSEDMNEAITYMEEITKSNREILGAMDVITDISEQTNLLALNAAIEAARAGEQGRGFAVVADEVRSLSVRSNDSAKQIRNILDKASLDVEKGSSVVRGSGEGLSHVVELVQGINIKIANEAEKLGLQNDAIGGVVSASNEVDNLSQNNAESARDLIGNAENLEKLANDLMGTATRMHELVNRAKA